MKKMIVLLSMVFLALVVGGLVSGACAYPRAPESEFGNSTAVFTGKLIEVLNTTNPSYSWTEYIYVFEVIKIYKGDILNNVSIKYTCDALPCGQAFEVGKKYLIYAYGSIDDLLVSGCGRTKLLSLASEEIEELENLISKPKKTCAKEGELCAGFAGTKCCSGLICDKEPTSGLGTCIKENKTDEEIDDETYCEKAGGEWRQFSNGCVDSCELARQDDPNDPLQCTLAKTMGCDCGPNKCWNEEKIICENNIYVEGKFCDEETPEGKCYKTLSNGRKAEIKIMPETASEKAIERLGELGFTIELKEVGKGDETKVVYELTGKKQGKFLGIFKIMARVQAQVDAETGEVKVIKPWWSFLASGV